MLRATRNVTDVTEVLHTLFCAESVTCAEQNSLEARQRKVKPLSLALAEMGGGVLLRHNHL